MFSRTLLPSFVAVTSWLVSSTALAAPSSVTKACLEANEKAQQLRSEKRFIEAREQLIQCSQSSCPNAVARDCTTWQRELEALQPTLTFSVQDGTGKDIADVRVSMDGKLLLEELDGAALPVNPGRHQFTFEHGDDAPIEQEVVVNEGEKARKIAVRFGAAARETETETIERESARSSSSGIGAAPIIVTALGAAGVITGLVLWSSGNAGLNRDRCGNGVCTLNDDEKIDSSAVTPIPNQKGQELLSAQGRAQGRHDAGIGIAIGGGVILAGGLTWLILDAASSGSSRKDTKSSGLQMRPQLGLGYAGVSGSF